MGILIFKEVNSLASAKILEKKKEFVARLSDKIKNANAIVFTDYVGLTVEQDTEMRKALREAAVDYEVVKNSMTNFAVKENGFNEFEDILKGPTAMATSVDDQ